MKYYYDCPFIAGYMAKYFGMEYYREVDGENIDFSAWDYDCFRECDEDSPLYIHPDSLQLLEPQVGDLIYCQVSIAGIRSFAPIFEFGVIGGFPDGKTVAKIERIVERNGKAFMWPEFDE